MIDKITSIPVNVINGGYAYCEGGQVCEHLPVIVSDIALKSSNVTFFLLCGIIVLSTVFVVIKFGGGRKRRLIHA